MAQRPDPTERAARILAERGRRTDAIWSLGALPIVLGRSYREMCAEPLRPLADAERRTTELAYVHLIDPGATDAA